MNDRDIFLSALEIEDADQRRAYLVDASAGDSALLTRLEALLSSHESQSEFLRVPAMDQLKGEAPEGFATAWMGNESNLQSADEVDGGSTDGEEDAYTLGYLQPSEKTGSLGRLGHYEILEVIGSGAFGTVLKASDEKLQRIVAIKVLLPEIAATSPARKRFLREARSSAAVRHENVVSSYAVENKPIPYLVMEFIPGETLQQRLDEQGPLDLQEVLRLGKQIADGLAAAHAQGLVHRDVKPGNILIDTSVDDHVKITDFGLARAADDASMTQSGVIAGTPLYMAPEQTMGRKLDQRSDLFSLGSVLYQMLSGRPPFRAPSTVAVLRRVADDAPRPIQEIIPEVPGWMCEIVGHLHAKDPDARYDSAKEVSSLLQRCLADVQQNRKPKRVSPARIVADDHFAATRSTGDRVLRITDMPLVKIAAGFLILVFGIGITEATGVTKLTSTVIRLATGSGTLVIETDDPSVSVSIDGEEVTIQGSGIQELSLRPGNYEFAASKGGDSVKRELVTITRNNRTVVSISFEPREPMTDDPRSGDPIRLSLPPKRLPFTDIRFEGEKAIVTYDGDEYQWLEIDGLTVQQIVDAAKIQFNEKWEKRVVEDLVEVLWGMGHKPGDSVTLRLRNEGSKEEIIVEGAKMTERNRSRVYRQRRRTEDRQFQHPSNPLNEPIGL